MLVHAAAATSSIDAPARIRDWISQLRLHLDLQLTQPGQIATRPSPQSVVGGDGEQFA